MRDTIDMMRDACDKDKVDAWQNGFWTITQEELKAFEALVRADEREACAKVCAEDASGRDSGGYYAEIIRDRSNT
jgi:hypothetical protein